MVPNVAVVVLVYLKNDREFINVLYGSLGDLRSVSSNFFKSLQVFAKKKPQIGICPAYWTNPWPSRCTYSPLYLSEIKWG